MLSWSKPDNGRGRRPPPEPNEPRTLNYQGNGFRMHVPDDWTDRTVYILTGPVADGLLHNVTINVDREAQVESVAEYADWQAMALERELQGCRLLKKDRVSLANGLPAVRVIFSWDPSEETHVYQEQIYVLHDFKSCTTTSPINSRPRSTRRPGKRTGSASRT